MAAGDFYLVHFPDGTEAVHNVIGGIVDERQELHLDGMWWIVRELPKIIRREEGVELKPGDVELQVWVELKPPEEDDPIIVESR